MLVSEARVRTDRAERYIAQLCKHFSHKVEAEYEGAEGRADFGFAVCMMHVEHGMLVLRCQADDTQAMARVTYVVGDHLQRFAWREEPEIAWVRIG